MRPAPAHHTTPLPRLSFAYVTSTRAHTRTHVHAQEHVGLHAAADFKKLLAMKLPSSILTKITFKPRAADMLPHVNR